MPIRASSLMVPTILSLLLSPAAAVGADGRGEITVVKAIEAFEEVTRSDANGIPPSILRTAQGIAIIPDQFKAGFVFGARYGRGLMVVRQEDGSWSNPVFVSTFGGSFGLQAGAQASDMILVFRGKKSVDSFLNGKGKITLGLDASVAAGPVGRVAEAGTDVTFRSEILSYSRSRGIFAGVSAGGGSLNIDKKVNADYYGRAVTPSQILVPESNLTPPKSALDLKKLVTDKAGKPTGSQPAKVSEAKEDAGNGQFGTGPATTVEGTLSGSESENPRKP